MGAVATAAVTGNESFALDKITVQSSPESFLGSMGTETDAAFLLSELNQPSVGLPSSPEEP